MSKTKEKALSNSLKTVQDLQPQTLRNLEERIKAKREVDPAFNKKYQELISEHPQLRKLVDELVQGLRLEGGGVHPNMEPETEETLRIIFWLACMTVFL